MKRLLLLLVAMCLMGGASAKVVLPKILGSNMVIQQQTDVNIWGMADAGKKVTVTVSWSKQKAQTVADKDGHWAVKVATPKGSFDAQTITISDGEEIKLENILIGDVWVSSGQSNMEMPMKGFGRQPVEQSLEYIMESGKFKNKIRMFTVTRNRSFEKDEWDCKGGEWQCATPKATAD
ncbi:MAG: sialate O-acetylesterase, partial [Alistipes sp.]|nr:sialate O-acetylesterase [Alistipes sp.]